MQKQLFLRPAIGTALLLSIPLVMTIVDRNIALGQGWRWGILDFVVMGALLFGAGALFELVFGKTKSSSRRIGFGLAISVVLLAIWVEVAVGGISQLIRWAAA